jgi:hypothetical protein
MSGIITVEKRLILTVLEERLSGGVFEVVIASNKGVIGVSSSAPPPWHDFPWTQLFQAVWEAGKTGNVT